MDLIPASALDRHSFVTLRTVILVLDQPPDMAVLRQHYGEDALAGLERTDAPYVILPPVDPIVDLASVSAITRIAERLRAPDGCPWDREQTHASLRPHLLEEAYEAVEALESGDMARLRDELGDLLFQIAIHAQLAYEEGAFDIADVARRLGEKLVRRHPHVFAGTELRGEDLLSQWERIKREEREGEPHRATESVRLLPPRIELPVDVDDPEFLGELLFDLVAAAREQGFDAESALREANERFAAHVGRVEERARAESRALESYSADEMRRLWDETAR